MHQTDYSSNHWLNFTLIEILNGTGQYGFSSSQQLLLIQNWDTIVLCLEGCCHENRINVTRKSFRQVSNESDEIRMLQGTPCVSIITIWFIISGTIWWEWTSKHLMHDKFHHVAWHLNDSKSFYEIILTSIRKLNQ